MKKARYLGVPCFYIEEENKIIGRNPITGAMLRVMITIDNAISWIFWKVTGKNRKGVLTLEAEHWFPWEPVFFWLLAMLVYLYFGGRISLIVFMVAFFFCVFKILMYMLSAWTK